MMLRAIANERSILQRPLSEDKDNPVDGAGLSLFYVASLQTRLRASSSRLASALAASRSPPLGARGIVFSSLSLRSTPLRSLVGCDSVLRLPQAAHRHSGLAALSLALCRFAPHRFRTSPVCGTRGVLLICCSLIIFFPCPTSPSAAAVPPARVGALPHRGRRSS